ncbi:MAG: Ldh family oxidoreductase [Actinomycetota bacterium]
MPAISLDQIENTTHAALFRRGCRDDIAHDVAAAVRAAEANGNRICGLYYVESYCRQLETGRLPTDTDPVVTHPRPGSVRVDARLGFAQTAFRVGFDTAVAAARANGIVGYAIEHSHTCTSLGYFTEQFARAGFVALGATNATPRVAAPGGKHRVLGTNPIAFAVPDGAGGVAFQFDFSTSAVALGRITMAQAAGEPIPLGWAVDIDGNPTTDADAALAGSLVSAGGYKGYGLGLLVEVLAAALTGSNRSVDVPPLKTPDGPPHDLGQYYVVIDPAAHDAGFVDAIAGLAATIEADPGARLPGAARTPDDPVDVPDALWDLMLNLAG